MHAYETAETVVANYGNEKDFNQFYSGRTDYGNGDEHRQLQLGNYIMINGIPWMSKEQADRCIMGKRDWKK